MTASLLVFVPVALLVLVAAFRFVGCVKLDTQGTGFPPYTDYSGKDVKGNTDCVAFWPLDDKPGQNKAADIVGNNTGTYRDKSSDPSLYKIPAGELGPTTHQAEATGFLEIGAPGIVSGATVAPHDPSNRVFATCMKVDGAFVEVAPNSTTNPEAPFSVEFWAKPEWSADGPPATRMVIDSRDVTDTSRSGFSIRVNDVGLWEAALGVGTVSTVVLTAGIVDLSAASHVVLTCDGTSARLFVNGTPGPAMTLAPGFVPNTTQRLIIGAGGAYLPDRTAMDQVNAFPFLPFNGKIQCVAIYNKVLSDGTISAHHEHGLGNKDEG